LRIHPSTAQVQQELAGWGAPGLNYAVAGERYWVARGGFFQVNRFLLPTMVDLVCADERGGSAWDLFAGVGLFARILTRSFEQVTAVEANPAAARELAASMQHLGERHRGVAAVIVDYLRKALLQRERPELVVLDPPRAGAGVEVCQLLAQIAPQRIVYVSCDPVTLARDLATLQSSYEIGSLHLVDLFPQTYHQEAVVKLRRRS
jgi:23S rRNA (uracil1939-C5)-methyltransferase